MGGGGTLAAPVHVRLAAAAGVVSLEFILFVFWIHIWREWYNNVDSVMQSDGNIFIGDVVLDSFNMSNRDEDSILDQK